MRKPTDPQPLLTENIDFSAASLLTRLAISGSSPLLSTGVGVVGVVGVGVRGGMGGVVGRFANVICRGSGPALRWRFLDGELGSASTASLLFLLGLDPPGPAIPGIPSSASSIIRFWQTTTRVTRGTLHSGRVQEADG